MIGDREEPALPEGRVVELPGRGATFVRQRAGPPGAPVVVLLHGLAVTASLNWFSSFSPLGEFFGVVALDQRGHGGGIRPRGEFRLEDCADDVAVLAEVLGVERLMAVGYSMGGLVAQLLWRRHPGLVGGLVLCSTDRGFPGSPLERLMLLGMPSVTAALRLTPPLWWPETDVVGGALVGRIDDPPFRDWARAEMRRSSLAAVTSAAYAAASFSSGPWVGDIDVPTAVVLTSRDQVVPPHRQLRLARSVPGATLHVVDAGHGACVTRPDLFVPALVEACRSVAARAASAGLTPAPAPSPAPGTRHQGRSSPPKGPRPSG